MKPSSLHKIVIAFSAVWLLLAPSLLTAQTSRTQSDAPQVERELVREGYFAVKLGEALKVVSTDNESEAIRELRWFKIEPRGGWIADQPVTPGILRELRKDVTQAAEDDRFFMNTDEALLRFNQVAANLGLTFDSSSDADAESDEADNEQPPAAKYYNPYPPSSYYDFYPWHPYPFAWDHWYFPGFFFMYDYRYSTHRHHYPHRQPPRTMHRR